MWILLLAALQVTVVSENQSGGVIAGYIEKVETQGGQTIITNPVNAYSVACLRRMSHLADRHRWSLAERQRRYKRRRL